MQKVIIGLIFILMAGVIYLGWREYLNEKRYERYYRYTSLLIDSLNVKVDSLKARRMAIRNLTKSIVLREKERKYEALGISSIDSLAFLANKLLAGKGN